MLRCFCQKYIWQDRGDSYKGIQNIVDHLDIQVYVAIRSFLSSLAILSMLDIKNMSEDDKDNYKLVLDKRKNNSDALSFLKLLDESDECCFLTGKAGTGKSTLIKDIIDFAKEVEKAPLVLGSTGISALNIGGQTVHSFFSLGIENVFPKEIKPYLLDKKNRKYKLKKSKIQTLLNVPFVVIDEIGMLNANTIDCVNILMQYHLAKEGVMLHFSSNPLAANRLFSWGMSSNCHP